MGDRHRVNRTSIDVMQVLGRLLSLPIETWNYLSQGPRMRHIGPEPQDFYLGFSVGEDEIHINMVDATGVAFAGIQGLYGLTQEQDQQIRGFEARLAQLEPKLTAKLDALEARKKGQSGR